VNSATVRIYSPASTDLVIMLRLVRTFSTSHMVLMQVLAAEQKALKPQVSQPLLNYPAARGFTLTQKPDSSLVSLNKQQDGYSVTVSFATQPAQKTEDEKEQSDDDEEEEEEEPFEDTFGEFQVSVTREGKGLLFECQSTAAQMEIRNVAVLPYSPLEEDYPGPVFYHLENKLKRASLDFLRAFGISDGTAAYVEYYSKERDKELNRQWIEEVQRFLKLQLKHN